MPVILNKVGEHRNQDAIELLVRYMLGSKFYWRYGSRGLIADSQENIIQGFSYTKQIRRMESRSIILLLELRMRG